MTSPAAPLLVTADEGLVAELLPLAAAADVTPVTVADPADALVAWTRAPVVLVGADLAPALERIRPEPRGQVFVVTHQAAPDELFRTAVGLGATQVVRLPASASWLVELLSEQAEADGPHGEVIGVIGGSGGAGATTLACAVGQWAARSGEAVVIDCDPQGPGLDRMLGLERTDGYRWDALCQTTGRLSARALREALPRRGDLRVLSWYVGAGPRSLQAFAVREALAAARRGHRTVVVDLPRTPDRLVDEVAARCDRLVVVTAGSLVGVASAGRIRARFADHPSGSVVLRGEALAAGDVARAVQLPVTAQMRDQRGLDEAVALGFGPLRSTRGPLARAAAAVLAPATGAREAV